MIKFTKMLMEEFLEQDLFSLFIQPVVDFRNDRVFNGEVLSRLNHPEYGMIFPDQFLLQLHPVLRGSDREKLLHRGNGGNGLPQAHPLNRARW